MKSKYVVCTAAEALFFTMILAVGLGAFFPSLLEMLAPYACPEGSEAVVYAEGWSRHGGESGEDISIICENSVAQWDRGFTAIALLACVLFFPIFLLMLFVWSPWRQDDYSILWVGALALVLTIGSVSYEQVTDPLDNPNLMFIDDHLARAIDEVEQNVSEPLLASSVEISIDEISIDRLFASDPKAMEEIYYRDGEVHRSKKERNRRNNTTPFLVSEVPWTRIPSFVGLAIDVAELDGARVSSVRVKSEKSLQITVYLKGFEYEATVVFDQEGTQLSMKKELPR
ncbi:MAG: hypothetical protein JKY56_16750 [Kofleriaceae bacterium]|nr:hypothetical protein [Kofleriaceae bacterium]